ncbi:MAG TPA: type II toxin-antitoxin system VapC family toxin [Longimicrobium sp.]|jgi:ribonuclease VapC
MVVDTSALIAVLNSEPESRRLEAVMLAAPRMTISAATLVEASIVAESKAQPDALAELDLLLDELRIEIIPVTREHAELARTAYRRFGKGRHPAALNFGDCFSYALARALGQPLLIIGSDFGKTDVEVASY